ncbi:MAG TPA: hypothetical protein GXZ63_00825 [Mollicutes bacterium]|nr:hypothetical protein [Mollicutes bacterium]
MSEKELIKKWKDLKKMIEETQSQIEKQDNLNGDSNQSKGQVYGGKAKTLGAHPSAKHFFVETEETENHKGYASALLLGFLTFLFQILFMAIVYIIVK